jgi:AraC-like DNA-binding protein
MLMIPLPFLPAAALMALAVWLAIRYPQPPRVHWLIAFLSSLSIQLVLLGARYGYGIDQILAIQHLTGVLIPPLAYLAFTNPPLSIRVTLHILPLIIMWSVVYFATNLVDVVLGLITFAYAAALAATGLSISDTLSWAPLRHGQILKTGLWATVVTLVLSGLTDSIVAVDFLTTGGAHTKTIAAVASLFGIALFTLGLVYFLRSARLKQSAKGSPEDQVLVERLSAELNRNQLFRDPDLTLGRLAKRLTVPARQISQAVNRSTGLNVSQFINNRRVGEVCKMLVQSETSITSAMLDAGFFTKSNFNREFRRVMRQSPSTWRAAERLKNERSSPN